MAIWALRLWERVVSVPCFLSFANSFGSGPVLNAGHDLFSCDIERRPVPQYAPSDTRELVGEGDGQLVAMHACRCPGEPVAEAEVGPVMGPHQDNICGLNKQHTQVSAAAL